jgi:hypothetical protein
VSPIAPSCFLSTHDGVRAVASALNESLRSSDRQVVLTALMEIARIAVNPEENALKACLVDNCDEVLEVWLHVDTPPGTRVQAKKVTHGLFTYAS